MLAERWRSISHHKEMIVKKLFAGLFLAASSLPVGFITGALASQHVLGTGWPGAIQIAVKTTASLLGLGLFVFMAGLVSKAETPDSAPNGDGWTKE
ncbi:hypothetical protein ACV4WP_16685 [Pseudomonas aeruginosa]|uniref:hypothetical protein n=1 Tax=Pseudomonas aeruginosa TaxID=287 RepID=UPI0012479363|nr:hypothetical protein [Pseudomonas aeruginosa]KAB0772295.1 hypothetical protein F7P00_25780 [Pseudomonas aeruginosa]